MEQDYEARLRLIAQLLDAKTQSSAIMSQYYEILREKNYMCCPSIREVHYILAIAPGPGKTITQLAEDLHVTQGAVSQVVSRLEEKGYLRRERNPANYRQTLAILTEQGEQVYYDQVEWDKRIHANMDRKYFQNYSDAELQMLRDYELWMTEVFNMVNENLKRNIAAREKQNPAD